MRKKMLFAIGILSVLFGGFSAYSHNVVKAPELKEKCEALSAADNPHYYQEAQLKQIGSMLHVPADPPSGMPIEDFLRELSASVSVVFTAKDYPELKVIILGNAFSLKHASEMFEAEESYAFCYYVKSDKDRKLNIIDDLALIKKIKG